MRLELAQRLELEWNWSWSWGGIGAEAGSWSRGVRLGLGREPGLQQALELGLDPGA